jgi:3-keto-disaccharide hydrolase
MTRRDVLAGLLAAGAAPAALAEEPQFEPGFRPLFNDKNLDGWIGDTRLWIVEGGVLVGRTTGAGINYNDFLRTKEKFKDFILKLQVRFNGHNSGIQFRSDVKPDGHVFGYQADIGPKVWGSLYHELGRGLLVPYTAEKVEPKLKKDGWNDYTITCRGDQVTLELNGVVTADLKDPKGEREGIIALQLHSGPAQEVFFRNIRIKIL